MWLRFKIIFLLIFLNCSVFAQSEEAFDQAYDKIWKEEAHKDLDAALASANSLYRSSKKDAHRIRCLIMIAGIYQQKEDLEHSVEYIKKAGDIAVAAKDYTWQTRVNSYLAGQYRMMELYDLSREYSEKALELLPKIDNKEQANSTRGLLYQEIAFSHMDQEDYRQAIYYFNQAGNCIANFAHNKEFNIMNNERLLGDNYRLLESYDTAMVHYQKAIGLSSGMPIHYTIGFAYKGIAEVELQTGDFENAKIHIAKAEQIANESQNLQLKETVYALTKEYYALLQDKDKMAEAGEKKNEATGKILDKRAELLDKSYHQFEKRSSAAEAISRQRAIVLTIVLIVLAMAVLYFIIYRRRKQLEVLRFRDIIEQLKKPKTDESKMLQDNLLIQDIQNAPANPVPNNDKKRIMPVETEQKLLIKLREFEQSNLFLEKGFSFTDLASWMQTNNKYLSFLLNDKNNVDFNNYINQLRVDYITKCLIDNAALRQYKIAALAEEAGFSSHSQFTAVFKNLKGITPSSFIAHLRNGTK